MLAALFVNALKKIKDISIYMGFFLVKQTLFLFKNRLIRSVGIINLVLLKVSETTIANNLTVCFLSDMERNSKELDILKT